MSEGVPWQLKMFQKTLKKQLRLKALRKHIGKLEDTDRCFLVTCGDNNGAINWYLRELGGNWVWADHESKSIAEMSELLGDEVVYIAENKLPFIDDHFDCVVSIDVHEHLQDPNPFTRELWRVTKKGGKVIVTVPGGDENKFAIRVKNLVGMTKEKYGHVREGFDLLELCELLSANGVQVRANSSFSKFFTEMLELSVNFLYVNVLSKKSRAKVEKGTIAPATQDQLKSVKRSYQIYSFIYPIFLLISKLDLILFNSIGYVIVVEGRKV
jgi:SAM-dependent methyltransferase